MVQGPLGRGQAIRQGGLTASEQLLAREQDLIDLDLPGAGRMGRNRPRFEPPLTSEALQIALENRNIPLSRRQRRDDSDPINSTAEDIRARAATIKSVTDQGSQQDDAKEPDVIIDPTGEKITKDASEKTTVFGQEGERQTRADVQQNFPDDKDKLALDSLLQANAQEGSDTDKKLLNEKFIDEYMSAMPAFEGKSKREKGFDLARLGMAIAAGQSPNAIQNISRGFLAMGDTFTSDAKEKREYERAIKVSAAKYGLESLNRLRVQQDQDKRNITAFKAKEEITLANGKKINKGDLFNLDMAYIAENGIPENALRYDYDLEEQKLLDTRIKLFNEQEKAAKDAKVMSDDQIEKRRKGFNVAAQDITTASGMISGVNAIQKDLIESNILFGAQGIGQASKETIKKFFGINKGDKLTRAQWISRVEILIQNAIPVTLGEAQSANSISDKDVTRLLKGYFDGIGEGKDKFGLDTAFSAPEVFFEKLEALKKLAMSKRQGALRMMNSIDNELEGRTTQDYKRASIVTDPFTDENFKGNFVRGPDGIFDLPENIREVESQRQKEIDLLRNPSP